MGEPKMTDLELGARLFALRDDIEPTDVTLDVTALPTRREPGARLLRAVATVVLVVVAAVLAIAPARTAVADWLGIGSTTIEIEDELPLATTNDPPATPTDDSVADIEAAAGADLGIAISLPRASTLGDPIGWEVRTYAGVGGDVRELVVDWADVRLTAWSAGADFEPRKIATREPITDDRLPTDGGPAYWLDDLHVRDLGDDAVLVDQTLLWVRDGVEYRLSDPELTLDAAIAIAATQP